MENQLPGIFALLVGMAGWYYLFYSPAANNLSAIERGDINRVRVLLRRLGGGMMILLAAAFYTGSVAVQQERLELTLYCLVSVTLLLLGVVMLGLIDLRLTTRLRSQRDKRDK